MLLFQITKNSKTPKEAINYFRINLDKMILNSFCIVGILSNKQMNLLNAKNKQIKFSLDSMLKNKINHPELSLKDYQKIKEIIINPDKIKLSDNKQNNILLLKKRW